MTRPPAIWPSTIRGINDLPAKQKRAIYCTLIPDWVYPRFDIDPETLTIDGEPAVKMRCPDRSRAMEISVFHHPHAEDPVIYLQLADSFLGKLMVLLIVINDPNSERFDIDVTPDGKSTNLGTSDRNVQEEIRAMEAGLAPGQIRAGLRGFRSSVPYFERFVEQMHQDMFLIEPLAYHNAVIFERYGFGYTVGRKEMERIHREFQPGGELHQQLDNSTPFRHPDAWKTVRGRSWAIHDGILGHPYTGFHMYKRIYRDAGVSTFPDLEW
ncbi:MAG: hypothetical protein GYB66_01650 [Chloroflexi bacterium]|nr:hypothetical protein [Chloroflexota bacterium]